MVDKNSDSTKSTILPGVELTPEARKILSKQLNMRIIWGHRAGKTVAIILGVATMFGAIIFATMVGFPISDLPGLLITSLFFGVPFLIGAGLLFLGIKS